MDWEYYIFYGLIGISVLYNIVLWFFWHQNTPKKTRQEYYYTAGMIGLTIFFITAVLAFSGIVTD